MSKVKQEVVNRENYSSIREMILSEDSGSHTVAMSILAASNFEKSRIQILYLIKEGIEKVYEGKDIAKEFANDYPELYDNVFESIGKDLDFTTLSSKNIFETIGSKDKEEMDFFLEVTSLEISDLLVAYNFPFMDYLDFKVTRKAK